MADAITDEELLEQFLKLRPCVEHTSKYTGMLHEESAININMADSFCIFMGIEKYP